ncbi:MAG: DUF2818 family protein [Variovorax sp.]
MSNSVSVWLVIAVAFLAANLPFANDRLLGVVALRAPKPLALRLAELVLLYGAAGALGLLLERRAGQISPQGWEFYAVTGALFLTFAFPGFIWRYLWKRKNHG